MTREEIKRQFPDATEEQITAILNINGAEIENLKNKIPEKEYYDELIRKAGEYDKFVEVNLTDAEKVQIAIEEANEVKMNYAKKLNKLDAEKILVSAGLTEGDYIDFIDGIVSDDNEATKSLASNLATLIAKQKEVAIQKTKEELMDDTRTPGGTGGNSGSGSEEESEGAKYAQMYNAQHEV